MCRLLHAIVLVTVGFVPLAVQADEAPLRSRQVRFTYSAVVREVPVGAEEVTLWLPFPPDDESQQLSNIVIRSDVPASVNRDDEYGNRVLSLTAKKPGEVPVRIELQFDVVRRERRNPAA